MSANSATVATPRWYQGITGYQWLVLAVASAGWVFDCFENQLFNLTRENLLPDLLGVGSKDPSVKFYGDVFIGILLLGGFTGGVMFGSIADRIGRRPAMMITILMYSVFSAMIYFATSLWQVGVLMFLVAMGTGGEWAVAAALVAEVFPPHARAHASGIFHSTSTIGTWLATLAGLAVGTHWRYAFLIGVVPALLVLWVRASVRESAAWSSRVVVEEGKRRGSFKELLGNPVWGPRAILGMLLAAVGLATYWGVTVGSQGMAREFLLEHGVAEAEATARAKFAYGIIVSLGGGLGLFSFGPLARWLGRRRAFATMLVLATTIVPITCYLPQTYGQLLALLPFYGFLTLGFHAGFAIYFPELFPTHLRSTGTGFCFNGGRLLAAPMLFFSGWLKAQPNVDLRLAITLLASMFLVGLVFLVFLPETKDRPLPE
ncbi:MAG TPA: MFS transporter [Verrucomicrobiae bacterium]|nr:MFS transporter [Verrucomicrobiae bacterium]